MKIFKIIRACRIKTWLCASFSRKIMAALLVCSTAVILLSSTVYYLGTARLLQKQYIQSNEQLLAEVNQSVSRYFNQLNETTLSLYNSDTFIQNLRFHRDDYVSQAENERTIKNILYADKSILYIYFYDPYTGILYSYSRENMSHTSFPEIENEPWYQDTLDAPGYFTVSPLHSFVNYASFGTLRDASVFSVNRALRYFADSSYVGMISIAYSPDALSDICRNLDTEDAWLAVLDHNLKAILISYPDKTLPARVSEAILKNPKDSGHAIYRTDNETRILLWNLSDGRYLLKDIPLHELTQGIMANVIKYILILTSIFLFLAIWTAFGLSRTATRKLNALTASVTAFGNGCLSIRADDYGTDEIGTLAAAFHEMTVKINELINLEYKSKLLLKSAELQMLQAQVKPHFINNALQALGTLGLKKGAKDVYLMANALARTLRYTLKPTEALIPLHKELENMNDYLYIQKILWGEHLNAILHIDEGIENWPVPVLILQPLVENSIKHGLDDSTEGTIWISIHRHERALSVTVSDDGRGIPPSTLKMLQEWLQKEPDEHPAEHIGIRNIRNRMRLIYVESASLTIDSTLSHGTAINIILPEKNASGLSQKEDSNVQSTDY